MSHFVRGDFFFTHPVYAKSFLKVIKNYWEIKSKINRRPIKCIKRFLNVYFSVAPTGTLAWTAIVFWGLCGFLMYVDLKGSPKWMLRYKVQPGVNEPVSSAILPFKYINWNSKYDLHVYHLLTLIEKSYLGSIYNLQFDLTICLSI